MLNLKVGDIRQYLPGFPSTTSKTEATKVPVMSSQSAEIYSKIRQSIPDTTESFKSVKTLEESAKEITASVNEIAQLKKSEAFHEVGSLLALTASVVLVAAVIAASVTIAVLFPLSTLVGVLVPTLIAPIGGGLGISALVGSSFWTHFAYNDGPVAQRKLSGQVAQAKVNHEKFKEYFTVNYQYLKNGIDDEISMRNQNLELMTETKGEDCEKLRKKFEDELNVYDQARLQLKNLRDFYAPKARKADPSPVGVLNRSPIFQ